MPDSLARPCVQGKQTISEEIVADAIGAVEIKRGGACWDVDNAAPGIERHSGPIVRGPTGLPRILRPSVIAKFTGMRDGVERPAQPTGSNVVGANVAGDRKSTRLNSSHGYISYAVFCLKKKKKRCRAIRTNQLIRDTVYILTRCTRHNHI